MSIKQRIWLLPAIAIFASILSLSANYWFSASAERVLAEADSVQYPAINALNAMMDAEAALEETLKYAVSVSDKNAIAAVDGKVAAFNGAATALGKLKGQQELAQRLAAEFDAYRRPSAESRTGDVKIRSPGNIYASPEACELLRASPRLSFRRYLACGCIRSSV